MTTATSRRRSHIYVDMPNLTLGLNRVQVNLAALLNHMQAHALTGTTLQTLTLYVHPEDQLLLSGVYKRFAELTEVALNAKVFVSACRGAKDVDPLVMNSLWYHTSWLVMHRHRDSRQIRHILVSGDQDYVRIFRSMSQAYNFADLDMEVCVYSWRNSLSVTLREFADEYWHVDDIPDITTV